MEIGELLEKFLEFEHRNNLFEQKIRGFKFWHFVRLGIFRDVLLKQLKDRGQAHDLLSRTRTKKLTVYLRKLLKYLRVHTGSKPLRCLSEKEILFICHRRRIKDGNDHVCLYTDVILPHIDNTYCVLEEAYQERHLRPVRTKNLEYLDDLLLGARLRLQVTNLLLRITSSHTGMGIVGNLARKLQVEFGVSIDMRELQRKIRFSIISCRILSKELDKIIERINPKLIIEVVSYDLVNMLINAVAKKRKIKTVELQHGTMGRYHIAYNFYARYNLETFPDYVFLFGNYWKNSTRLPLDDSHLTVTGFPYFEEKVNQYKGASKRLHSRNTILFVSQGTIGKPLSRLACDLANMIDMSRYSIIYKLHPGEYLRWRKEYPWLRRSKIEVIDNNEKSVYYYFAISHYLVGVQSTTIFESLPFCLRLFIFAAAGHEHAEELYNNGYAKLISSAEEIVQALDWKPPNMESLISEFWESNACRNILENIEKLMPKNTTQDGPRGPEIRRRELRHLETEQEAGGDL